MKRVFLVLIAAGVLFLLGRQVFLALVSDETKVRWRVEGMVEGFNAAHLRHATAPIATDWRDSSSGVDRDLLRRYLVSVFMQERHHETRSFLYACSLGEGEPLVVVDPTTESARAEMTATFERLSGTERAVVWIVEIEAELELREEGWKVVRTSHTNVRGRGLTRR